MTLRVKKHITAIFAKFIAVVFLVGVAYTIGTFLPNNYAVKKFNTQKEHEFSERFQSFTTEPPFEFVDNKSFVSAVYKCINYLNYTQDVEYRVPTAIIAAMAIIESAFGTSRFAQEGNALFGVRTWDLTKPHMKPRAIPNAKFGVKKYNTKCQSVRDMIRIVNNHPAYEDFRIEREKQLDLGFWDYKKLVPGLSAWSINENYTNMIMATIQDNNLN